MVKKLRLGALFAIFSATVLVWVLPTKEETSFAIESEKEPSAEFFQALKEEYDFLKDPQTGKIPEGIRELELEQAGSILRQQLSSSARIQAANVYTYQGPSNLGGRTRSIAFDVSDATGNTMLAGSVSGGVFKTTNGGTSWTRVNPANQLFSVTAIAQDTRAGNTNTWYYGGGEPTGNSAGETGAGYSGYGVFKSTDGGNTWSRLSSSNTGSAYSFDSRADYINNIAVNPVNGDVYVACVGQILRSQDGGSSWAAVQTSASFTSSAQFTHVAITAAGVVYTAFTGSTNNGSSSVDGVWTSATGDAGSYTRIAGTGSATTPAGWNAYGGYGRVVLGIAPSNPNIVYALYYKNVTSSCTGTAQPEAEFFRWDNSLSAWTDLSATLPDESGCSDGNDPFAVQGGYDLVVAVKPDDPNTVFIGGTNAYRSTDGGGSWTRIGGYAGTGGYGLYTNHHPDIHALVFSPGSNNILFSGDDGGIQKADITAGTVAWTSLNNGYQTYQYYHVAIKQESGVNDFLGGAQDNGTTTAVSGSTTMSSILSGDGVSVGLGSGAAPYMQYGGSQSGTIYRRRSNLASGFINATLTPSKSVYASIFVTYFYLDPDNTDYLYHATQKITGSTNKLLRITSASTAANNTAWQEFTFDFNGYIRSMATTRGAYSTSSRLYMGTSAGKVYRLTDPANAALSATPDLISSASMPTGTVLGIAVNPTNHDEIMVVYSNYNVINIWHTSNAGDPVPTWTNIEGNLTLPSVRTCMIANNGATTEYYVGTSVGLYKTSSVAGAVTWVQESPADLGNSLVTGLALRTADNTFAIGTHGSGLWKGIVGGALPVRFTEFSGTLQPNNTTRLDWETSEESENKGYEVERSYDGQVFKKIGFVKGAGTSSYTSRYAFTDTEVAQENNYYRLKQVDFTHEHSYSTIILVRSPYSAASGIKVLGNPFRQQIDLELPKNNFGKVHVRLIDMKGSIVLSLERSSETQRMRIPVPDHVGKGTYLLQVTAGNQQYATRVVRQ